MSCELCGSELGHLFIALKVFMVLVFGGNFLFASSVHFYWVAVLLMDF